MSLRISVSTFRFSNFLDFPVFITCLWSLSGLVLISSLNSISLTKVFIKTGQQGKVLFLVFCIQSTDFLEVCYKSMEFWKFVRSQQIFGGRIVMRQRIFEVSKKSTDFFMCFTFVTSQQICLGVYPVNIFLVVGYKSTDF